MRKPFPNNHIRILKKTKQIQNAACEQKTTSTKGQFGLNKKLDLE